MFKNMDFDPKTYPISCHWVKEIDNDSNVNASSFWFSDEKLINFSATTPTEAEFV